MFIMMGKLFSQMENGTKEYLTHLLQVWAAISQINLVVMYLSSCIICCLCYISEQLTDTLFMLNVSEIVLHMCTHYVHDFKVYMLNFAM